ncbi:MAG TPA: hypothetical protein VNQ73_18950 [Ilumatobacter sp.]|nr:hypothetical protein [Ilumatobacter sp.]
MLDTELLAWLDATAAWSRKYVALVGESRETLRRGVAAMVFEGPAGDRTRELVPLIGRNLSVIEDELYRLSNACIAERERVEHAGQQLLQWRQLAASDAAAARRVQAAERDPAAWLLAAGNPVGAMGGLVELAPVPEVGSVAAAARVLMEPASVEAAAKVLSRAGEALLAHQSAINRQFARPPAGLLPAVRERVEAARSAYAAGLERMAFRLQRDAADLRRRATTPGLLGADWRPDVPPLPWIATPKFMRELIVFQRWQRPTPTDQAVSAAEHTNDAMARLVRPFPVIAGSPPASCWKPTGDTPDEPWRPVAPDPPGDEPWLGSGVVITAKRARARVTDWASYASRKGVLARSDEENER